MTAAAFLAFVGLVIFAAISPGPAVLMSARTGLTEGFRTGLMLAMGIGAGAVFWAAAAMFGHSRGSSAASRATSEAVSSFEPSSTTMISICEILCARAEASVASSVRTAL